MNSSFTTHYIQSLATFPALPESSSDAQLTSKKQNLQSLVSLKQPLSRSETRDTLHSLENIERDNGEISVVQADEEECALRRAVLGKIVIGLYAEALDTYLTEASEAEAEAEWWADVERSRRNVAYYFVQSEYLMWPLFE
jgi:nuclear-control-of-ATPase protein 2